MKVIEIQPILDNIWQFFQVILTIFTSNISGFYRIYWEIMRFLWKFTKVDESYNIPRYFFGQITYFRSVLFNYNVLLAFHNFVPWWTKFFCLLLFCFTSRQHWQIFRHCQTKGDISNIADTYNPPFCYFSYGLEGGLRQVKESSCTRWLSKLLGPFMKVM